MFTKASIYTSNMNHSLSQQEEKWKQPKCLSFRMGLNRFMDQNTQMIEGCAANSIKLVVLYVLIKKNLKGRSLRQTNKQKNRVRTLYNMAFIPFVVKRLLIGVMYVWVFQDHTRDHDKLCLLEGLGEEVGVGVSSTLYFVSFCLILIF